MQWNETHTDKIPPTTETQAKLIGTWQWTVTFHERPLQGQLEINRVTFAPDHTFLILLPNPGAWTWQSDVSDAISFSFTELLKYHADGTCTGYVIVTGRGSLSQDGTSFTASGQGVVYSADGTYLATNKTTAQGTRIRHNDSQEKNKHWEFFRRAEIYLHVFIAEKETHDRYVAIYYKESRSISTADWRLPRAIDRGGVSAP